MCLGEVRCGVPHVRYRSRLSNRLEAVLIKENMTSKTARTAARTGTERRVSMRCEFFMMGDADARWITG